LYVCKFHNGAALKPVFLPNVRLAGLLAPLAGRNSIDELNFLIILGIRFKHQVNQ